MSNPNKALGTALENRVVKRARARGIPADRQPGSGIYASHPNDVVIGDLLVECKVRTIHPSLNQMFHWLYGCIDNARKAHKRDGILVYNEKGSSMPLVLLELDTFLDILKCSLDTQNCEAVE